MIFKKTFKLVSIYIERYIEDIHYIFKIHFHNYYLSISFHVLFNVFFVNVHVCCEFRKLVFPSFLFS